MQAGPGRVSARAGEAVDVLPEGPTQLLRPRRLPLLLQPAALHQPRHPDARQGHHPGGLLHARQQVECSSGSAQSNVHGWIVMMTTLFTGSCKSRASGAHLKGAAHQISLPDIQCLTKTNRCRCDVLCCLRCYTH